MVVPAMLRKMKQILVPWQAGLLDRQVGVHETNLHWWMLQNPLGCHLLLGAT
jgi:hypothetical protein